MDGAIIVNFDALLNHLANTQAENLELVDSYLLFLDTEPPYRILDLLSPQNNYPLATPTQSEKTLRINLGNS